MMRNRAVVAFALFSGIFSIESAAFAYGESDANGFPNWSERVLLEWTNRARSDPQADLTGCTSCGDKACYSAKPPYVYNPDFNHSARFHSAEASLQTYSCLDHYSHCAVVGNIAAIYPATCNGAASCACTGGDDSVCGATCPCVAGTAPFSRVALFATGAMFEGIASYDDPDMAFYQWLDEAYSGSSCSYDQGSSAPGSTNGHRYQLIDGENGGSAANSAGFGVVSGSVTVVDDGMLSAAATPKIPSGSHYPRQAASVDAWANWADAAGPQSALVNVDGECTALHLERGVVTNGAYHVALTTVASGCHRYFFNFKDSTGTVVTFPETGSLGIGPEATCADFDMNSRPTTGASCNCTPQCSGKTCGDDGCGGACGNCAGGSTCNASGACIASGPGSDGGSPTGKKDGGIGSGFGDAGLDGDGGLGEQPQDSDGDLGECLCTAVGKNHARNSGGLAIAGISFAVAMMRRRRRR